VTAADRRAQLAASLAEVRERISRACSAAGRPPDAVTLVAVTKTYPASDVVLLSGLGVTDVGENKDQEAEPKAASVRQQGVDVRWHFVGRLQRNKAKSVVRYVDVVESVDSVRLATALGDAAARHRESPLDVLVSDAVASSGLLRLRGVMAVAPADWEAERAFAALASVSEQLVAKHPGATAVSAGMSGDLEQAVRHGATHVRIGTSLLGMRKLLR
jgi:uncharacterized pyridoxal phosphate-containing UPF0001 family protein